MEFHTDEEEALLETFRQNGGQRIFFHRRGKLKIPRAVAKTLSRLIRSGHIEREQSGDFNCIYYRIRESAPDAADDSAPTSSQDAPRHATTADASETPARDDGDEHV